MKNMRNKVQLIGNLGMTPEVKEFEKGKKMAKFSLATNESYYDTKGNKVENTQWHNLIAWGHTAEKAEKYLDKGSEVAVEGKIINKVYEDKSGTKKYYTDIEINDFIMLGRKN